MGRQKPKNKPFKREDRVRTLKILGDRRWKDHIRADLKDLSADEEGMEHLAAAIKAILRSDRWHRKPSSK